MNFRSFFYSINPAERRITISTWFTITRCAVTPVIVSAMLLHYWGWAFVLFVIAAVTDVLDGFIARLLSEKTLLGAYLDPIADKFLLLSCFITLAFCQSPLFRIPIWFVSIVLVKEVFLISGALFISFFKGIVEVRPTALGKATTVFQVLFIIWLFACYFFRWVPIKTYYCMLAGLLTCVVASGIQYTYLAFRRFVIEG